MGRDGGSGLSGWQPRAQHRGWRRICASAAKTFLGMHVCVCAWPGRGFPSYSLLTPHLLQRKDTIQGGDRDNMGAVVL